MIPIKLPGDDWGYGGAASGAGIDGLCTFSLSGIIMELSVRAGMDPRFIDVAKLDEIAVRGFAVINTYPCFAALQSLSQVFLFDPSNFDGRIHFVPRGLNAVATISEDEIVIDDSNFNDGLEDQSKAADPISIPKTLNLNYYDIAGGLATDKQTSERAGDRRATGEQSLQTAILLSADEAKRTIVVNHKVMIENQKAELRFSLSDSHLNLTTADCIFMEWDGEVKRVRIEQADINDGKQAYICLRDRQGAYVSNAEGYPASIPTPPPSRIVGSTLLEAIDIHILRDSDDFLGCYLAVSGRVSAWYSAIVELSLDGGQNYLDSFIASNSTIIGVTTSAITDHPPWYMDTHNTLNVHIELDGAGLSNANQSQLQNRANLAIVGNELIQFGAADETSPNDFSLSKLLRGRNQSETVPHSIGERFVILDRNSIYFIPLDLGYLNRNLTVRATSSGGNADEATVVTFLFTGQSQVERAPGYLRAQRIGTDVEISWQGIGKLGSGASVAMGVSFAGYHIKISDGSVVQEFDQLAQNLTTSLSAFAGPITIEVSERNSLTGLGPSAIVIV